MKKSIRKIGTILISIIVTFSLTGCFSYHRREKKYYSDVSNYITEEAIVENIIYNEEEKYFVFWLAEIDDAYQSSDFKIKGESVTILLERKIGDKVKIGDEITYTSAPEYFGDGYFMPIVAISVNGEDLLTFDEGYNNLMKLY